MCAVSVLGDVAVPAAVLPHRAAICAVLVNQGVHAEARFLVLELAREHERCGRHRKRALGQGHEICMLRTHPIMRWVRGHRVSDRSHVSVAVLCVAASGGWWEAALAPSFGAGPFEFDKRRRYSFLRRIVFWSPSVLITKQRRLRRPPGRDPGDGGDLCSCQATTPFVSTEDSDCATQ
jgi:hypothetical protein